MNINLNMNAYNLESVIGICTSLTVLALRSASIAGRFTKPPELATVKTELGTGLSILGLRSGPRAIARFIENHERGKQLGRAGVRHVLETTTSLIGVVTGIMGSMRSLETFKLIKIANISAAIGGPSPMGQAIVSVFSFSHVLSGLNIVKSGIGIAIESIKIHERGKKITHAKNKVDIWRQPTDQSRVQEKINTLNHKIVALNGKIDALQPEIKAIQDLVANAAIKCEAKEMAFKNATGLNFIPSWVAMKVEQGGLEGVKSLEANKEKELKLLRGKKVAKEERSANWQAIDAKWDDLKVEDHALLQGYDANKLAKWKGRIAGLNFEQGKAGFDLFLKVVGLVMAVTVFALGIAGGFATPLLALSCVGLGLGVVSFGYGFFKRHTFGTVMKGVQVPTLGHVVNS